MLGHEIAHVEKNHAYQIVRMSILEPALNAEKEKETKEKRAIATAAVTFATGGLGGIFGGLNGAIGGGVAGLAGGLIGSSLIFRDHNTVTEWDDIYENEADEDLAELHAGLTATMCARRRGYMRGCRPRPRAIRASDWALWRRSRA